VLELELAPDDHRHDVEYAIFSKLMYSGRRAGRQAVYIRF